MVSNHPTSNGLFDKAGADTPCTGLHPLDLSRFSVNASYLLKVWVPSLCALVVCMTDHVALHGFLAAYLTDSRHKQAPL
jgi:hypothetical protein